MRQFLRKVRIGSAVIALVVIGGGFATAAGNDPATTQHDVQYEILSFRAISLDSDAVVDFGQVRQGHSSQLDGPVLKYATTWAGDRIQVAIDTDVAQDVALKVWTGTPAGPSLSVPAATSDGGPACDGASSSVGTPAVSVILNTLAQDLVTDITDCGIDMTGYWVNAQTYFLVDASAANSDINYSGVQVKTVTYTIDAAA